MFIYIFRSRSTQLIKTAVLGDEASLRSNVGEARVASLRLYPVNAALWVQELRVGLFAAPDQHHLEGVEEIRLLTEVAHVVPRDHKDGLGREIAGILEAITN